MNKEVIINKIDGELVVTSRQVAKDFEKDHRVVVRAIENKVLSLTEQNCSVEKLFIPSTYNHNGNEYKEYLLTRDGFTFIVMGFTGAKADIWKLKYIEAFNKMEEALKEKTQPKLPTTYKEALLELVAKIEENEKLEEENRQLVGEIEHKEDVIIGLVTDIDLAEKRQRISQIVRHGTKRYSERYNLLYSEFNKKYHTDVKRRLDNAKARGEVKKSANVMAYICDVMNMTAELYELSCKLFENDVKKLMEEMWDTAS